MDLPAPILTYPERPFGPGEARIPAATGRRDCGDHTACLRVYLLNAIFSDLKQVLAVEGRSSMRRDIDRADRLATDRIEGIQLISGSKPNVLAVIGDTSHAVDTLKGAILLDDFGS